MSDLPALSGYELIRLLELDGWQRGMRGTHGQSMYKYFASEGRKRVTVVSRTRARLPRGTLGGILGVKQTGLGRKGLLDLLRKHGGR